MGNQPSLLSKRKETVETSKVIDKKLRQDHKRMKKEVKILLLGKRGVGVEWWTWIKPDRPDNKPALFFFGSHYFKGPANQV